jgi:sulfur relay protein TusB/DsrH
MAATAISGACLHLVVRPGEEMLGQCLAQTGPNDTLLFLDGGVTSLFRHAAILAEFPGEVILYAAPDLAARGLLDLARSERVTLLEDPEFVGLLARHATCLTWK